MAKDKKKQDEEAAVEEAPKAEAKTATADEAAPANAELPKGWTAQQARAEAMAAAAKNA